MTSVNDNYTGHVEPGTAAKRTLPGVSIVKASVGPMDNNAYLVTCSATGEHFRWRNRGGFLAKRRRTDWHHGSTPNSYPARVRRS